MCKLLKCCACCLCSCAMSCVFWILGIALVILAIGLGIYFGIFHNADKDPETEGDTLNTLLLRLNETIQDTYK